MFSTHFSENRALVGVEKGLSGRSFGFLEISENLYENP